MAAASFVKLNKVANAAYEKAIEGALYTHRLEVEAIDAASVALTNQRVAAKAAINSELESIAKMHFGTVPGAMVLRPEITPTEPAPASPVGEQPQQ